MINYYAYYGHTSLEESKKRETNSTSFKAGNDIFAVKLCNKKFGENNYKLFSFIDFNNKSTFNEIV